MKDSRLASLNLQEHVHRTGLPSGVNIVYGHQRGLAIALVNYAESMNGLQLGVINIIRDNPSGRRVLPVLNWGR